MSLPNFDNQLSQRADLCAPLKELIGAFYMLEPTVKFVANARSRRYPEGVVFEGERPIGSVQAYKDSQHLGNVRVAREDYRGLGKTDVYYIGSDKVKKTRGRNRDEVITKDSNKAIKLMLEYFKPKADFVFRDAMISDCTNKLDGMRNTARYKVSIVMSHRTHVDIALYLLEQHEGLTPALPSSINRILSKPEELQKFHDLRISESVYNERDKGGAIVVTFSDNSMWYADLTKDKDGARPQIVKLQATYDLPQNYQEKFTLLKLCESSQPVENVGVKFADEIERDSNAMLYYLVGGDTITTC